VDRLGQRLRRPPPRHLVDFLGSLRDPVLAELVAGLEPVGEPAVHRQTGNHRHGYGRRRDWPAGLLVVGDALCAFNPLYGQGITVAAIQAGLLADALRRRRGWDTRRVQRRFRDVTELPWTIATGEDRRHLGTSGPSPLSRRVVDAWSLEVGHLLMAGDRRATTTFNRIYHLMGSPRELLHPALFLAAARRPRRVAAAPPPRPPELQALQALLTASRT
jgi:hypothetical protein